MSAPFSETQEAIVQAHRLLEEARLRLEKGDWQWASFNLGVANGRILQAVEAINERVKL